MATNQDQANKLRELADAILSKADTREMRMRVGYAVFLIDNGNLDHSARFLDALGHEVKLSP